MRATTHMTPSGADEMRQKIDKANAATKDRTVVHLSVSRQDYLDLLEAYRFLRQTSPWLKSVGQRLEKLGIGIRDALDRGPDVNVKCEIVNKAHNGRSHRH